VRWCTDESTTPEPQRTSHSFLWWDPEPFLRLSGVPGVRGPDHPRIADDGLGVDATSRRVADNEERCTEWTARSRLARKHRRRPSSMVRECVKESRRDTASQRRPMTQLRRWRPSRRTLFVVAASFCGDPRAAGSVLGMTSRRVLRTGPRSRKANNWICPATEKSILLAVAGRFFVFEATTMTYPTREIATIDRVVVGGVSQWRSLRFAHDGCARP
jgi:hypothetical protein